MIMNELVKFLVNSFLGEDTNMEYDGSVPAAKEGDDFREKILKDKRNLKKLKEFLKKHHTQLNENLQTSLVDGGTNDLSPFATVQGYYKYSIQRSENSGYKFLKDTFDPSYVYGNEQSYPPKKLSNSDLNKILEVYDQIDNLYLEYVMNLDDSVVAKDGSEYDSMSGDIGNTSDITKQTIIPKNPVLGNGFNANSTDTKCSYKHKFEGTPKGKHI
jgi:hypothetical protein